MEAHYDRLTALDAAFLDLEDTSVHMHVGSVGIFEAGPLSRPEGGIDFERVIELAEAGLAKAPRFRQVIANIPVVEHPVWVDDLHFNIRYHVRQTALPYPGDERLLKRLTGRIMSQKLDRTKPLWELWIVEGLPEHRIALISKIHHCLIDGISGVDLMSAFMGRDPDHRSSRIAAPWKPRPHPSNATLLGDEIARRVALPLRAAGATASSLAHPMSSFENLTRVVSGLRDAVGASMTAGSETPLNRPIGPHRRFDWARFDLATVKDVKRRYDCKLNDVVLACVAGALRPYLGAHDVPLDDIDFRVFVPVSTRAAAERGKLGNRVSSLVVRLPVDEPDPRRRIERVIAETTEVKHSHQTVGTEVIEELSDWTVTSLLTGFSRLAASQRSYNMVVTNVPGPPWPVYMEGARMLASYPLVPLFSNQALGIALLSYDDALHWGFNSDWDAVPDLHDFVAALEAELDVLSRAAP